jgi:ribosome maturation factor RimP
MATTNPDRVRAVVAPVVVAAGMDLEDLTVTAAGRRRLLRIGVDRDGGVSLDDVAGLSQRLSHALDETDVMGGQPYVLEVGSPGLDRPLTEHRHWRRAVGRLVEASLADGTAVTGRVLGVDSDGAVIDVPGGHRRVSLEQVRRARVQVEFGSVERVDVPGQPLAGAGAAAGDGADGPVEV